MPPSSSIWTGKHHPPTKSISIGVRESSQVVVIGAGACGLVTAAMLSDNGLDVTVLDARRSADSVTARSSAKVSVLHELTAAKIASQRGEEMAAQYMAANRFGFDWIQRCVDERHIDCAWEERDAITYVNDVASIPKVRREVELYRSAGFDAESTNDVGLPYAIRSAVRLGGQAQFDPLAFLDGLTADLTSAGHAIVDGVRTLAVRRTRRGAVVETGAGNISADHVVIATGLPFLDHGAFFARTEPQSSYVVGCEVDTMPIAGMYLSADGEKRSLRTATTADGTDVLLVGGEGHKTGQGGNTEQHYTTLAACANANFGLRNITHRFMAQDYTTPDHSPFAGPLTPGNTAIFVATGMNKWGFTNSAAAAAVNVARIVDGPSPSWSNAFNSMRLLTAGVGHRQGKHRRRRPHGRRMGEHTAKTRHARSGPRQRHDRTRTPCGDLVESLRRSHDVRGRDLSAPRGDLGLEPRRRDLGLPASRVTFRILRATSPRAGNHRSHSHNPHKENNP